MKLCWASFDVWLDAEHSNCSSRHSTVPYQSINLPRIFSRIKTHSLALQLISHVNEPQAERLTTLRLFPSRRWFFSITLLTEITKSEGEVFLLSIAHLTFHVLFAFREKFFRFQTFCVWRGWKLLSQLNCLRCTKPFFTFLKLFLPWKNTQKPTQRVFCWV